MKTKQYHCNWCRGTDWAIELVVFPNSSHWVAVCRNCDKIAGTVKMKPENVTK